MAGWNLTVTKKIVLKDTKQQYWLYPVEYNLQKVKGSSESCINLFDLCLSVIDLTLYYRHIQDVAPLGGLLSDNPPPWTVKDPLHMYSRKEHKTGSASGAPICLSCARFCHEDVEDTLSSRVAVEGRQIPKGGIAEGAVVHVWYSYITPAISLYFSCPFLLSGNSDGFCNKCPTYVDRLLCRGIHK